MNPTNGRSARARQIADLAQTNQALIGYHFGGKGGLYAGVVEHAAAVAVIAGAPGHRR